MSFSRKLHKGNRKPRMMAALVCAAALCSSACLPRGESSQVNIRADASGSINNNDSSSGAQQIRRDSRTGAVKSWRGDDLAASLVSQTRYASALASADVVAMAREFLLVNGQFLGLDHSLMHFKAGIPETLQAGETQVRFTQYLREIPVVHSMIVVHFDALLRLQQFRGDYLPMPVAIALEPKLTWEQACAVPRNSQQDMCKAINPELVIYRSQGGDVWLTYSASIDSPLKEARTVFLDATSGRLLSEELTTYPIRHSIDH